MSKQVKHVNIVPEILHGNWSSYWKYNEVVMSCKSFLTIHYNAGHTYTIQVKGNIGMVKKQRKTRQGWIGIATDHRLTRGASEDQ